MALIRLADQTLRQPVTTLKQVDASGRTALSGEPLEFEIETYPNPFTESFTIRVKGNQEGQLPMTIYDGFGRTVLNLPDSKADQVIRFGPEFLPGLYVIKVGEGRQARSHTLAPQSGSVAQWLTAQSTRKVLGGTRETLIVRG